MEANTIVAQDPVKVMALHEAVTIMGKALDTLFPVRHAGTVAEITIDVARQFEQYLREIG